MTALSVLLPIYDYSEQQARITIRAFRAITAALDPSVGEVVVVDDGSPCDIGTNTIQSDRESPIIFRRHSSRLGLVSALNTAAHVAHGEILTYCHTDCIVERDALRSACRMLLANPLVGMTVAELYLPSGELQQVGGWIGPNFRLCWSKEKADSPHLIHWGDVWSVRREIFVAEGGLPEIYNPGYWECVELGARVRNCGYSTVTCPGSRVMHLKSRTFHNCISPPERDVIFERNRSIFAHRWQHWHDRFVSDIPGAIDDYEWR